MTEHIKMTTQEAKQKAEAIRKIILDTYHNEVKPSPFFSELRAGTLSRKRLQEVHVIGVLKLSRRARHHRQHARRPAQRLQRHVQRGG